MGKTLSVVLGAVASVAGLVLLVIWWGDLLALLKGVIPGILILAGAVSVIAGISEFKDTSSEESEKG